MWTRTALFAVIATLLLGVQGQAQTVSDRALSEPAVIELPDSPSVQEIDPPFDTIPAPAEEVVTEEDVSEQFPPGQQSVPETVFTAEVSDAGVAQPRPVASAPVARRPEPRRPRSRGPRVRVDDPLAWKGKPVEIIGIDRTQFPEIMLVVSVHDPDGVPVTSLDENRLTISEDEAPQEVLDIAPCVPEKSAGDPLNLAILIDSSGSMQQYMDIVQNAAARFVDRLRDDDNVAVVTFCNEPLLLQPPTLNKKKVKRAIYQARPRGFTALYDSMYTAVAAVSQTRGRRAVVLITDGRDNDGTGMPLSSSTPKSVIEFARKQRVPIFIIGIGSGINQPVLEQIGRETVGEFYFAPSGGQVDHFYSEVARDLGRGDEGYYALRYRTTLDERDGTDRTLVVCYMGACSFATYPGPTKLIWPLTKVLN